MNVKNASIFAAIILLLGILNGWPYLYFILLRWAITFISIYVAYEFKQAKIESWMVVFGVVALVFNPIFPIYLTRQSWIPIDFVTSILFFFAGFSIKNKHA